MNKKNKAFKRRRHYLPLDKGTTKPFNMEYSDEKTMTIYTSHRIKLSTSRISSKLRSVKHLKMSTTQKTLEIHVGRTNHQDQPEHWLLMLRAPGDPKCTFIHSTAECIAHGDYSRSIEHEKHFEHVQIPFRDKVSFIKAEDEKQVIAAAEAVEPQHCQRYVLALLEKLEGKGLVPKGTADGYRPKVQPLIHEGPVKEFTKAEFDKLVVEQGGKDGAVKYLLRVQGWVDDNGKVLWKLGQ
jgi:hypothetical protein